MTSSTDTTTDPTALESDVDLVDLDSELVELTSVDATRVARDAAAIDTARVEAAALATRAERKEKRAMTSAWVALFAGLAISLGSFASIAWHDSVAANGPRSSVESTTTAP
jgi:hypothetical protein